MKIKSCKFCGSLDDGIVPFVHDERKCIPCRNRLKREKYNSDKDYRNLLLTRHKKYMSKDDNKKKFYEYIKAYHLNNKESIKKHKRKYVINNKDKVNSITAKRRANKLLRVPSWQTEADIKKIEAMYSLSRRLTSCLGIEFHVDHIVPLQGKSVSGLHTPSNLQVITAYQNFIKGNSFQI